MLAVASVLTRAHDRFCGDHAQNGCAASSARRSTRAPQQPLSLAEEQAADALARLQWRVAVMAPRLLVVGG